MRNPVLFGILLVLTILIMIYEPAFAFGDSSSDTIQQKSENMQNLHFPYNQICAPGFTPLNDVCVLNDRCGPGIYPGKICVIDGKTQPYLKLPYQKYAEISVDNVICTEGKKLMLKSHDLSPVCVNSISVEKLGQRGWDLPDNKQKTILSSKIVSDQNLSHSVRLDVKSEIIGNDNYLIFEGSGWHNFHSVEITINNNGKELASIRSKINDNGVLYVPWSLPVAGLPNGLYTIFATDGIHQKKFELSIPITADFRSVSSILEVEVTGENQVRRGTTHFIEINVHRDEYPVTNARVSITIENYGEDIIREFDGYTNHRGNFVFSWEIPKSFDDIETLLAFVDVTDGISSKTKLFKFQVYCYPGEKDCNVDGN